MQGPFYPDPDYISAPDVFGIITRKVREPKNKQPRSNLTPETLVSPERLNQKDTLVRNALSIYDGNIFFDKFLNDENTIASKTDVIRRVLMAAPQRNLDYLAACGFSPNVKTAGFFCGKIDCLRAVSLLREIYANMVTANETPRSKIEEDVKHLNHYVHLTDHWLTLYQAIQQIAPISHSLAEFEQRLIAHFIPVNNAIHARRIFNFRARYVLWQNTMARLKLPKWDHDFETYYILGILSRIDRFDFKDRYQSETAIHTLRGLLWLSRKVVKRDFHFGSSTLMKAIREFIAKKSFNAPACYFQYVCWLFYHSALHDRTLMEVIEELQEWETHTGMKISFRPRSLSETYRALPYYNLEWAVKELDGIVVVQ